MPTWIRALSISLVGILAVAGVWVLARTQESAPAGNSTGNAVTQNPSPYTPTSSAGTVATSTKNPAIPTPPTVTGTPTTTPAKPTLPNPKPRGSLSITSITPSSGPAGTQVTIKGMGFNATSQIIISNGATHATVNATGTVLTFAIPEYVGAYCKPGYACAMYAVVVQPGTYAISVRNDDGTNSNSVNLTITNSK